MPEKCKECKWQKNGGCYMWNEYCITAHDLCECFPNEKNGDKPIY